MATAPRFFDPNLYYHIYNCGVEKRDIFLTDRDYFRLMKTVNFYRHNQRICYAQFQGLSREAREAYLQRNPKDLNTLRVKIISYTLMPNHFHFLLKPVKEDGITQFIADISNSHTRYFNIKNKRIGGLLQGTFKAKEISSDESLLQVTRYIHLNSIMSSKTNPDRTLKLEDYRFCSYPDWTFKPNSKGSILTDQKEISDWVELAGGREAYRKFVEARMDRNPKIGIEDLVLE